MKSPAWWIIIGLLGIMVFMGDSPPTLGIEEPPVFQEPGIGLKPPHWGTFSLLPITGVEEAQEQISWCKLNISVTGKERLLKLAHLARLYYFLGEAGDPKTRKENYEQGRNYATLLTKEQPRLVAGYYWLALNLCGLASISGAGEALRLLPRIIELLETSLHIDGAYDQGGAHRVLGRIYFQAPSWPLSVGDGTKSLQHLAEAVKIAPENSTNHLFLAEMLYFLGKTTEAIWELEKVIDEARHALWTKGLADDQKKAQELIKEYKMKRGVASSSRF